MRESTVEPGEDPEETLKKRAWGNEVSGCCWTMSWYETGRKVVPQGPAGEMGNWFWRGERAEVRRGRKGIRRRKRVCMVEVLGAEVSDGKVFEGS
jgi:hypothetical protein